MLEYATKTIQNKCLSDCLLSNKSNTDVFLLCCFYVVWPDPERWLMWVVYSWTQWRKWERAPPLKDVIEELFENDQVSIF